jgi:HNH endonuclease
MATRTLQRLWAVQRERLATGRGMVATALTAFVVIAAASSSRSPGSAVLGFIVLLPAIWWAAWWSVRLMSGAWGDVVRGRPPAVRVGRQWQSSGSTRQQLREDGNARVFSDRGGILLRKRRWFVASGTPPFEIPSMSWATFLALQPTGPQYLVAFNGRSYWWYQDTFYWTNADYDSDDVRALLFARERQRGRELEHAHALLAAADSPTVRKREPIPKDVKHAVWQRDEGHCVECGSAFDLQYDHIIPLVMGGASTVENLQLLCGRCNQAKGGRL